MSVPKKQKMKTPEALRRPGTIRITKAGGQTQLSFDTRKIKRPERSFPADCCEIVPWFGAFHVRFGLLDPFEPTRLLRVLAVRLSRSAMRDHVEQSKDFVASIFEFCGLENVPEPVGTFTNMFRHAHKELAVTDVVDADFLKAASTGPKCSFIAVSVSAHDVYLATSALADSLDVRPEVEVDMPLPLLRDLYVQWLGLLGKEIPS